MGWGGVQVIRATRMGPYPLGEPASPFGASGPFRSGNDFHATMLAVEGDHMATLRERLMARREAERRKLRSFTIG